MRAPGKPTYSFLFTFVLFIAAAPGICHSSAIEELPMAVKVVISKAHELMQNNSDDQALEVLEKFQARSGNDHDPKHRDPRGYHHPEIYFAIANIHLSKGDHEKAEVAYQHALARNPDHLHARLNLAKVYYDQEKYGLAAENFLNAYATTSEEEPEYLYYAAVTRLMDNAYESAIHAFEQLINQHPDDITPQWRENMVHALLSADRAGEALPHMKRLASEYDGDKRVQWQEILLYQYIQLGMEDRAEDYALALTRISPTTHNWWKALAHVALTRNNYENALVALTIYGFLTPLNEEEKKLLADLNLQVGIPVMAIPAYEAVLGANPDKNVLRNLVIAYQQMGLQEKAVAVIDSFGEHEEDPEIMILKADMLYTMGKFETAADAYRTVAEANNRHAGRAWLMAGYAAWQLDALSAAQDAFEKAAGFDSQKKDALSAIEQLVKNLKTGEGE